jgi:hypothetical protein
MNNSKLLSIRSILSAYNIAYLNIESNDSINRIYELYHYNNLTPDILKSDNEVEQLYVSYYWLFNKRYDKIKIILEDLLDSTNKEILGIVHNNYGFLYDNGYGVSIDHKKAIYHYRIAFEEYNNLEGLCNIAQSYKFGEGVDKDIRKSIHMHEQAIKQNYDYSMIILGNLYYEGDDGIDKDYKKACYYYYKYISINKTNNKIIHKLTNIINGYNITWNTYLHSYWLPHSDYRRILFNNTVITLLMISRYRRYSNLDYIKLVLVKGIIYNIINWYGNSLLCN